MYSESTAGLFRANPEGASPNNLRLVDPTTPGTPAQDNAVGGLIFSNSDIFEAIGYIGKSGVVSIIPFADYQYPDGGMEPTVVPVTFGAARLQQALRTLLEMHEVDPIITVRDDGGEYAIRHVGSGTLDYIIMSGVAQQLTRTAL